MALLDKSVRYDTLKPPFMGHALGDLLTLRGGKYQASGSFSFTTKEEYENLTFIDTTIVDAEIDQWTGDPTNQRTYEQIKDELPSWKEVLAEHQDNLKEYDEYAGKRARIYPDWRDQLDLIYKDIEAGKLGDLAKTSSFYQTINKIKTDNP